MLDPVRFLSNVSTGEMGYALAKAAVGKKFKVTLISGPTALQPVRGVKFVPVISAEEMERACRKLFPKHDILIMTAAVCDFTAYEKQRHKIRRTKTKQILLKRTPDIVAGLAKRKGRRVVIGFCLETENLIKNAKRKLKSKNLDGIVANYYRGRHIPFGNRKITVVLIDRWGRTQVLQRKSKKAVSMRLLDWMKML